MIRSVAVIGVGSLGGPIARRLHVLGYDVVACDRDGRALDALADLHLRSTTSAAACADADLVLVLVATPDQARDVVLGDGGLLAGIRNDHRPVVGIVSTVSRDVILELAEGLLDAAAPLVDIPVSGGPLRALDGTLTVLAAGDPGTLERLEPVLAGLGQVFPCGPLGNAQVVKLVNNLVCAANVAVMGEVLRLALACGLSLDEVLPVLEVSTGRNFMTPDPRVAEARLRGWTESESVFASTLAIVRKDVALAAAMAEQTGTGRYEAIEGLTALLSGLGKQTYDHWRVAGGERPAPADR